MSLSGVRGIAAGVRVLGRAGLVVCAVLGGLVVPDAVSGSEVAGGEVEVRVVARKAPDGRVEFGLRQRLSEDSWGEIRLPSRRFFPATAAVGRWLQSSPVVLTAALPEGLEVRVVARRAADGRVEFGLRQRLAGDVWGEIELPSRRFFPVSAAVGRWLQSSPVALAPAGAGVVEPPEGFVSVGVGGAGFACGVLDGGSVGCWGVGRSSVAPEGEFVMVAAGLQEACGVRVGGEVHCWGGNSIAGAPVGSRGDGMMSESGEVPVENRLGDPPDRLLAESVPSGAFVTVDVGDGAACGVRVDGGLACWGPVGASWALPDGRFAGVAVGLGGVACGVAVEGTVACWGEVSEEWAPPVGRFGSVDVAAGYACGLGPSGRAVCWGPDPVVGADWVQEAGGWAVPEDVFVDVALNDDFACGVRAGGEVQCWGPQGRHVCADGRSACFGWDEAAVPPGPFVSLGVARVRSGWYTGPAQVCGIRRGGQVLCWNDTAPAPHAPSGAFVDVNEHGSCGVRAGGAVVCWRKGVEYVMADGEFTAMSGSEGFGCGLRTDGALTCWGDNTWGAAAPPPGPFTAIDVTSYLGCGLRPGGEATCWGRNDGGQDDPPAGPFTAITARTNWQGTYACGLRPDAGVDCWGPRAALGQITPAREFSPPEFATDPRWRGSFPGGSFSRVAVSRSPVGPWTGACGVRPGGDLVCWRPEWPPNHWTTGDFVRSATGESAPTSRPGVPGGMAPDAASACDRSLESRWCVGVPEQLDWVRGDLAGGSYVALASGWHETCGLRRDDTVQCWGSTPGSPEGRFTAVAVGPGGWGIRPDGAIQRWEMSGRNRYDTETWTGLVAPADRRFIALDSGLYRFCGLLDDGGVVCEDGSSGLGQRPGPFTRFSVGGGDSSRRGRSADVSFEENGFVCAIRTDGSIECWGANDWGQTALSPWLDIPPYRDIAAGLAHACAIGAHDRVICWGDDRYGQTRNPPGAFTALSAGQWHTCGLRADGEITCWGNGAAGFDLHYDAPPTDRPGAPPPGPFTAVSAGFWHTCGLRPNGDLDCWLSY